MGSNIIDKQNHSQDMKIQVYHYQPISTRFEIKYMCNFNKFPDVYIYAPNPKSYTKTLISVDGIGK